MIDLIRQAWRYWRLSRLTMEQRRARLRRQHEAWMADPVEQAAVEDALKRYNATRRQVDGTIGHVEP